MIQTTRDFRSDLGVGGWSTLWRDEDADRWSSFARKNFGNKSEKPTCVSCLTWVLDSSLRRRYTGFSFGRVRTSGAELLNVSSSRVDRKWSADGQDGAIDPDDHHLTPDDARMRPWCFQYCAEIIRHGSEVMQLNHCGA